MTGIEQGGASSLPSQTNFFLSAFTRVSGTKQGFLPIRPWARIRLLGAPTGSVGDVVSAFQDPSGALKDLPKSKIGQSVDFVVGAEVPIWGRQHSRYSGSLLFDFGSTTPLSSQDVISKFKVPVAQSAECGLLVDKFSAANGYPSGLIVRNTDPATPTVCLANGITTLAFNSQERDSFLRKYNVGLRTTFRYLRKVTTTTDISSPEEKNAKTTKTTSKTTYECCEYGTVDWTLGQDEAITGGKLHRFAFRIDGSYPLPIGKDPGWLYLFGTVAIRLQKNVDSRTLILAADSSGALPSDANVALLPVKQPNKDYYRFGLAIGIDKLFSKLAK